MTARPYAADDGPAIRAGLERLRVERDRVFRCTCEHRIGPKGEIVSVLIGECPLHSVAFTIDETEGLRIGGCRT